MQEQKFGGEWSEEKLKVLESYLRPYLQIFDKNERARFLHPHYVDAFAGCGTRTPPGVDSSCETLFGDAEDMQEATDFATSSPRLALGLDLAFEKYVFIENNPRYAEQLEALICAEFPSRQHLTSVHTVDSNAFLPSWCESLGRNDRAVMFLDPYGIDVNWTTVQSIASSQKVDLWILLPCSGVLRMLPKRKLPTEAWIQRLNDFLGTERWQNEWYQCGEQADLFGDLASVERRFGARDFGRWITKRLKEEFAEVVPEPLILCNSRNSPLFMLTFAAGNPNGAPIACRIAREIINSRTSRR